ncbi:MAG: CNNM domain-containing protein [Bacteroides sp.]|nr:CNNM domain-containing protein [Bacillota bacterium]MCM1394404.1 CNNM domain-containing protein [[Eubacterium] siraeum]MCM1455669.1 CNNM domain-containing protein [Bacteroides sp.]
MDTLNDKDLSVQDDSDNTPAVPERVSAQSAQPLDKEIAKTSESADGKRKKVKKKRNIWWLKASVISFVLAGFFSFLSELTASAEQIVIIILLLAFLILASILFDSIGVAVTSCDIAPIASMASRKVHGAKTALWLVRNSGTVSSICNDVIGDIFGIISGACSAAVVVKIAISLGDEWQRWLTIIISAVVSAVTIGGKAFMKNIAINNSKDFVMFVARIVSIFNRDERKIRKKDSLQKKSNKEVKRASDEKNIDEQND